MVAMVAMYNDLVLLGWIWRRRIESSTDFYLEMYLQSHLTMAADGNKLVGSEDDVREWHQVHSCH